MDSIFEHHGRHRVTRGTVTRSGTRPAFAGGLFLIQLAFAAQAKAFDYSFKVEGGFAVPLTTPQSRLFDFGGAAALKALLGLGRYADIGPSAMFVGLPATATAPSSDAGIGLAFGGGLRLKRPHDAGHGIGGASPWVDGDALYVRTGPLDRFGFAAAAGVSLPLDRARRLWLGPFVRYFQIVQPGRAGYDNSDAKILIAGLNFEVGSARRSAVARDVEPPVVSCPPAAPCPPAVPCPLAPQRSPDAERPTERADRDRDGVPDEIDLCPDVPGSRDRQGCPIYQKVIVRKDKIELQEHILFAWDQASIKAASYSLLDDVVQALTDNRMFHVRVEGHTDSTGGDEHNQRLSEQRARAVLEYLVSHGVQAERLRSRGFGSSVPLETNKTAAGREANRRVEFVMEPVTLNDGRTP